MEGRSLAFTPPTEPKKIDINVSKNTYLPALRKLYSEVKTPTPEQALLTVMQEYLNKGMGLISSFTLHHQQLAADIKAMLEKNQWKDALTHLSTIKNMDTTGDFALALATFFNFFPKYLTEGLRPAFEKSLGQELWQDQINAWLIAYMAEHRSGAGSNDHENLELIATQVPAELAEEFAEFLLGELENNKRPEHIRRTDFDHPGLYLGWVCIALGNLAGKLGEAKKQAICERLKTIISNKRDDYSLIGAVIAISKMTKDGETLGNAATIIREYTKRKLLAMKDAFRSTNPTISSYASKLFNILFHFESFYKQDKRDELVRLVTGPNELFALRNGIHTFHSWMQPVEKDALLRTLQKEPNFEILFPYFYPWISNIQCGDKLVERYYDVNKACLRELSDEKLQTNFSEHIACIITDSHLKADTKKAIITKLTAKVREACTSTSFQPEHKNNLFNAIVLAAPWFGISHSHSEELLNTLIGALDAHKSQDHGVRSNILAAIFSFIPYREFNSKKFRNELLATLADDPEDCDINALRNYARNVSRSALPDLLNCLASIPAHQQKAHVLFLEIHQLCQQSAVQQEKQEHIIESRPTRRLK